MATLRSAGGADWSYRLEFDHLVSRSADFEFACVAWRLRRRGNRRVRRHQWFAENRRLDTHAEIHRPIAADWNGPRLRANGAGALDFSSRDAGKSRQLLSPGPIVFGGRVFAWAWRQRCAKDNGHHHRSVDGRRCRGPDLRTERGSAGDSPLGRAISARPD